MIIGLHHVHVICGDVEKTAEYFKESTKPRSYTAGHWGGTLHPYRVKGLILNLTGNQPGAENA